MVQDGLTLNVSRVRMIRSVTIDSTEVLGSWEIKRRPNRPGDRYIRFACNNQQKMSAIDKVHHVYYPETDLKMLSR